MGTITLNSSLSLKVNQDLHRHGHVTEEIEGLIRVYKDGHVERPQIMPCVAASLVPEPGVTSQDITIDEYTNIWARFYAPPPSQTRTDDLPMLVYFHGGGFCVGSAAWSCYHQFLSKLSSKANCLIMSVNYRLAPENPLPAAYEDGFKSLLWLKQQVLYGSRTEIFSKYLKFSSIFLAGDSAGANIAYHLATKLCSDENIYEASILKPLVLKGTILIQPFFGGETRTKSEKYLMQPPRSALSLAAADTYWRLALPRESNRDHPWCKPAAKGSTIFEELRLAPVMVCVSEMDILIDRNLEFVGALARAGKKVEQVVCKGVGHAFQILSNSQVSQARTDDLMVHIKNFVTRL